MVVIVLFLVGGGIGVYFKKYYHSAPVQTVNKITTTTSKTANTSTTAIDGYNFYSEPKTLGNLNFFSNLGDLFGTSCNGSQTTNCPPMITANQINYVQIGTNPAGLPVIVAYDYSAGEGSFAYFAVENTPGSYRILGLLSYGLNPTNTSDQGGITTLKNDISSNVSLDTTTTIAPFNFTAAVTINGEALTISSDYSGPTGYFIPNLESLRGTYFGTVKASQITKLGQDGDTSYYEVIAEDEPTYQVQEIYAVVDGVYATEYDPVDTLVSSSAPAINWDNGGYNANTYSYRAWGCGSAEGYVIAKSADTSDLTAVGSGPAGETIYEFANDNPLFTLYYQNYGGGTYLDNASLENLSVQKYQNDYAVIVAKNPFGEYVVYQRTDMSEGGGCGKPVIYLYPTQTTDVSVRVGANIAASNPTYPVNGWQDVLAMPSGQLTYQGQSYPYLYWEGTGLGVYPLINSGVVVSRADAVPTIEKQLAEQGLTAPEIKDFMAYWQPRLPSTPYVRLTWLDTAQMNTLAPLLISPKPTTLIRVFLDFQGLNKPITLKPQVFTAPVRQGFTVVEWGGLIRY